MYYYNCLFQGVVKTIKEIEEENNLLKLSTNIEKEVKSHKIFNRLSGRKIFYLLIYITLLTVDAWYGIIVLSKGVNFILSSLALIVLTWLLWFFFKEELHILLKHDRNVSIKRKHRMQPLIANLMKNSKFLN